MSNEIDKELNNFLEAIENKTGEPIKVEICDLLKKFNIKYAGAKLKDGISDLLEKFEVDSKKEESTEAAGEELKDEISDLLEKFEVDSKKEESTEAAGKELKDGISDLLKKFEVDSKKEESTEAAGKGLKDGISDLMEKFEDDSKDEETIKDIWGKLEKQLVKLANLYITYKNPFDEIKENNDDIKKEKKEKKEKEKEKENIKYLNKIKEIKKAIKEILESSEIRKKIRSEDKKEYYDSLMDDIQYLIIYKLCFLVVIREQEVDWIEERRKAADKNKKGNNEKIKIHEKTRNDPFNDAMGLAFSGGGIRSATFNLGLLQALERCNILKSVDYLSTVSGGGYIASSLTWFMSKNKGSFPFGTSRKDHGGKSGKILSWLRDHGNYMAPGNGLDLPALIVAVLTSILINGLILVPLFLLFFYFLWTYKEYNSSFISLFAWGLAVPTLMILYSVSLYICSSILKDCRIKKPKKLHEYIGIVLIAFLLPLIFSLTCKEYGYGSFISLRIWGLALLTTTFLFSVIVYVLSSLKKDCSIQKWCRTFKEKKLHEYASITLIIGLLSLGFGMIPLVYTFLNENLAAISSISFSGLVTFLVAFKGLTGTNETKGFRSALLSIGLSLIVLSVFLWFYHIVKMPGFSFPALFGFVVLSLWLAWRININYVSIHRYYRNRLMEAYMPWAIIGEDRSESDEFPLAKTPKTRAPYHIISTTINMVGSKKTKQRERGGDSFVLSPLFCGSEATGYAATSEYVGGEVNLATALAVSGAAVNPNTYVTRSKPITFLMSLLNARLGYWIKNPSSSSYDKNSLHLPYYSYVFREMFGRGLSETKEYIHLSDGGHFENLGLYELVRRRCRYIIVSDASNDPNWSFGDLARVIEMVRVDFGAEVNLDTRPLQPKGEKRIADQGFIRGTVTYKDGKIADLIYINTVIIDGLPEDIYSYRRTNLRFPEQTTSDQFFDEKQFEAYRELGFQLGFHLCGKTSHEDFTAIFKNE